MRHDELHCRLAAVRLLEVRDVYASREFDWGEVRREALEDMEATRIAMLNEHLGASL